METPCANPECAASFRDIQQGRVFVLDTETPFLADLSETHYFSAPPHAFQYYWLCDVCAQHLTLQLDEDAAVSVVPAHDCAAA